MFTRRAIMKTTLAAGSAAVFAPAGFGRAAGKLSWQHVAAGDKGFFRAPVIITGSSEALLIDGGFNYADGRAVADAIKATGRKLTTIYVSQSDPDYYFSLKPIKNAFPDAKVIAAPETVAAIKASVEKKLAVWGPQLKENGPQTSADVIIPDAFDKKTLTVDGETIEIVDLEGLTNRRYLFVPSLNAVFGGVAIFNGVHVWTADTPTREQRAAWLANLENRRPQAGDRGARAHDAGVCHRYLGCRAHQGLSCRVRAGTGQGQGRRHTQGRHGSPLPGPWHGRRARHRRQGGHRRDEVGLRWGDSGRLLRIPER